MPGTVLVRVISDATQATQELDEAGNAVTSMADKMDNAGGKAAKLSGGLGDVGGSLSAIGESTGIAGLGEFGAKMESLAPIVLGFTGLMDLATLGQAAYTTATNGTAIASARAAGATVAAKAALLGSAVATAAATVAQWAMNAAMYAFPLLWIVGAVLAVVAVGYLLFKNWDKITKALGKAWDWIKTKVSQVWGSITNFFTTFISDSKTRFNNFIDRIKEIFGRVVNVANKVRDFRDRAIGYISGLITRFKNLGKDIMRGLRDGIVEGIKWVKDKVKGLGKLIPNWLKDVLGIHSRSKVMLALGKDTMRGLTAGMESQLPSLESTLGKVSSTITGLSASPSIDLATAGATGIGRGVVNYYFTIQATPGTDRAALGDEIKALIKASDRRTG